MKVIVDKLAGTHLQCECQDCGSRFEYESKDIQRREDMSLCFIGPVVKRFVICPVCKYECDVNLKKAYMMAHAKKKEETTNEAEEH